MTQNETPQDKSPGEVDGIDLKQLNALNTVGYSAGSGVVQLVTVYPPWMTTVLSR